jgi:hypothetical protein
MIANRDLAQRISSLMLETAAKLDATIAEVQRLCPEEEFVRYRTAAGRVMGSLLLDIMNPIYAAHPDLKPMELK